MLISPGNLFELKADLEQRSGLCLSFPVLLVGYFEVSTSTGKHLGKVIFGNTSTQPDTEPIWMLEDVEMDTRQTVFE